MYDIEKLKEELEFKKKESLIYKEASNKFFDLEEEIEELEAKIRACNFKDVMYLKMDYTGSESYVKKFSEIEKVKYNTIYAKFICIELPANGRSIPNISFNDSLNINSYIEITKELWDKKFAEVKNYFGDEL